MPDHEGYYFARSMDHRSDLIIAVAGEEPMLYIKWCVNLRTNRMERITPDRIAKWGKEITA